MIRTINDMAYKDRLHNIVFFYILVLRFCFYNIHPNNYNVLAVLLNYNFISLTQLIIFHCFVFEEKYK